MKEQARLDYLDGIRGFAALWVFTGHLLHEMQWDIFLLSKPTFAVDLFMLVSGFLMYHHGVLRQEREPSNSPTSWLIFWTRRFFRLAPAYYVILAIAFLVGPYLLPWAEILANPETVDPAPFVDSSPTNIMLHISFLFGFLPEYATRVFLPDWSLALEMQFYLLFPFILLAISRSNVLIVSAILVACSCIFWAIAPDYMEAFGQPTFILLKINIFLAGILIAMAHHKQDNMRAFFYMLMAMVLVILPLAYPFGMESTIIRLAFIGMFLSLVFHERIMIPSPLGNIIGFIKDFLGNRFSRFLSDTSYVVYLVHMIVLIPVGGYLVLNHGSLGKPALFFVAFAITAPTIYLIAYAMYRLIEIPGINAGKKLTALIAKRA